MDFLRLGHIHTYVQDLIYGDTIIGRYCRIDANVVIGFRLSEPHIFSNHYFAYSEDGGQTKNESYKKIKTNRFFLG